MSAGMLSIMFISHDLVGFFFVFVFVFVFVLFSFRFVFTPPKEKARSFATILLAGSVEHLLRRITVELHVTHCVK